MTLPIYQVRLRNPPPHRYQLCPAIACHIPGKDVPLLTCLSLPNPGALFTNLAPSAIALASYFCLADIILITQCIYYNAKNARSPTRRGRGRRASREEPVSAPGPSEHSPLLAPRQRSSSVGLPGSFRQSSTHEASSLEPLRKVVAGEDQTSDSRPWLNNTLALLAVWLVGGLGWFVSYKFGAWDTDSSAGGPAAPGDVPTHQIGSILGYISAVLYLW